MLHADGQTDEPTYTTKIVSFAVLPMRLKNGSPNSWMGGHPSIQSSIRPTNHPSIHPNIQPSIHIWHYSPFRVLASLIRRLHSSPFSALLLLSPAVVMHPSGPYPPICFLVFPLVLCRSFRLKLFFWNPFFFHAYYVTCHPNLLIVMSSTMSGSLHKLYSWMGVRVVDFSGSEYGHVAGSSE